MRGGVPFGLRLLGKTLKGWTHGQKPAEAVAFEKPFSKVKQRIEKELDFFQNLISRLLINNPHCSLVTVRPDALHEEREEEKISAYIEEKRVELNPQRKEQILSDMENLRIFQDTEDGEEVVSTIPVLALEDLPRDVEIISYEMDRISGIDCYYHDLFTNGIVYLDLAFNTKAIPEELVPYLPLYSKIVCNTGIPGVSYDEMARRLSLYTGGVISFLEASNRIDRPEEEEEYLFFRIKTLEPDLASGFSLVRQLLLASDFSDRNRIKDLVLEYRNDLKSSILNMGNSYAGLRAAARISPVLALEEKWRGISQYLFVNSLCESLDSHLEELVEALAKVRNHLNCRNNLSLSICSDHGVFPEAVKVLEEFIGSLGSQVFPRERKNWTLQKVTGETLLIPGNVGYAATAIPGARLSDPGYSREQLLAHLLKTDYLWNRIRMRGGAYGVSASANGSEGIFLFSTYRDPQVAGSLSVFIESLKEMQKELTLKEMEKAIIGVVGKESHPMVPGEKSLVNFRRRLYGIDDSTRQKRREAVLSCTPGEVCRAAEILGESRREAVSSVMAGALFLEDLGSINSDFEKHTVTIPV